MTCWSRFRAWALAEDATLKPAQIISCRVTFLKTKNGKKPTVPISEELEKKVKEEASAKLFKVDYEKFYRDFTQSETWHTPQSGNSHPATYIRKSFHDEWGQHNYAAADSRASEYSADDGPGAPCAWLPAERRRTESS